MGLGELMGDCVARGLGRGGMGLGGLGSRGKREER